MQCYMKTSLCILHNQRFMQSFIKKLKGFKTYHYKKYLDNFNSTK